MQRLTDVLPVRGPHRQADAEIRPHSQVSLSVQGTFDKGMSSATPLSPSSHPSGPHHLISSPFLSDSCSGRGRGPHHPAQIHPQALRDHGSTRQADFSSGHDSSREHGRRVMNPFHLFPCPSPCHILLGPQAWCQRRAQKSTKEIQTKETAQRLKVCDQICSKAMKGEDRWSLPLLPVDLVEDKALPAANVVSVGKVGRGRRIIHTSSEEVGGLP